jgi:hypothetical protein
MQDVYARSQKADVPQCSQGKARYDIHLVEGYASSAKILPTHIAAVIRHGHLRSETTLIQTECQVAHVNCTTAAGGGDEFQHA